MNESHNQIKIHYTHRISSAVQERIAGIFVLSAVAVITGLILFQSNSSHLFDERVIFHAYLTNAQGISTETLVTVSGIEVGRVESIDITQDNKIHVKFFVFKSFQRLLRTDSSGELNKLSVIGNAAIIVKAGSPNLPVLAADATIPIEEPVSIDDLMAELTPAIVQLKETVQNISLIVEAVEPQKISNIMTDLTLFVGNLRKISDQVAEGQGPIGKILFDEKLEQDITHTIEDISPIVTNIGEIVKDTGQSLLLVDNILRETHLRIKEIADITQPAAKLINKLNQISADLHVTSKEIDSEIKQLPELVNKINTLLDTSNRTLSGAQEIWPLSTVIAPTLKDTIIEGQPLDD